MPSLTIYLSDGLLSDVESVSKLKGISISKVLAESFRSPDIPERVIVNPSVDAKDVLKRLDRIEGLLGEIPEILKGISGITKEMIDDKKPVGHIGDGTKLHESIPDDDEIISKAQEKLEAVKQRVQTSKGEVKANEAFTNFMGSPVGPQPKSKGGK